MNSVVLRPLAVNERLISKQAGWSAELFSERPSAITQKHIIHPIFAVILQIRFEDFTSAR